MTFLTDFSFLPKLALVFFNAASRLALVSPPRPSSAFACFFFPPHVERWIFSWEWPGAALVFFYVCSTRYFSFAWQVSKVIPVCQWSWPLV